MAALLLMIFFSRHPANVVFNKAENVAMLRMKLLVCKEFLVGVFFFPLDIYMCSRDDCHSAGEVFELCFSNSFPGYSVLGCYLRICETY